jgi:hypothetical protein
MLTYAHLRCGARREEEASYFLRVAAAETMSDYNQPPHLRYICVLILRYICVLILLYMCPEIKKKGGSGA